jgi:hypothetical protein
LDPQQIQNVMVMVMVTLKEILIITQNHYYTLQVILLDSTIKL